MKKQICIAIFTLCLAQISIAQHQEPEKKTKVDPNKPTLSSADRTKNVMDKLNITDATKRATVNTLVQNYLDSQRVVFTARKKGMDDAKTHADKELADARATTAWAKANGNFNKLQAAFLGKLSTLLTADQVDVVKDVLTEFGLKREYDNYLDLFPTLNEAQKTQVISYLKEARENAINGETAENRVDWFIKFRGRANNYLVAAGYNLRTATEAQEKRTGIKSK